MRVAQRRNPAKSRVSTTTSIPAPVGGWNARDALGNMSPEDAVSLVNWFPTASDVAMRMGHTHFATSISGKVETLMTYSGLTSSKLLAAAGTAIYDISAGGAVGAAVQSALTNARWQYVNYANTAGNFLYMVNGADAPRYWDGTTWTNAAITGVTPASLIHINEHKNRLWFVEKDTLNAWYLGTSSIAGAATKFNLSGIAQRGGYLVAMTTWTMDAGYGQDDMAVFFTSQGEVIIYRGTDPSSSTTWALIGVWWLGSPVGRRCFSKFRGDVVIINKDGVVPLTAALQSSRVDPQVALSNKIQSAASSAIASYSGNFGWQVMQYPKGDALIVNVPVQEGSIQQQYVMNTITGAWCSFTGWNANCWEMFNDDMYFGGDGFVAKAFDGLSDNGADIQVNALQAFNYFGSKGVEKQFKMARPVLQTNGTPSVFFDMNTDFDLSDPTAPLAFVPTQFATWGVSLWGSGLWGSSLVVAKAWQGCTGLGYCAAPRLKASAQGIRLQWVSTDVVMERGGVL